MKLFSELIGSRVILAHERALVGPILDLVISPEDGALLGFSCFDPILKKVRFVAAVEIRRISGDSVLIGSYDSLSDANEVVRIQEAIEKKIKIVGSKVFTKDGRKVGRVNEAALNIKLFTLERIYVTPNRRVKFLANDRIIPAKKIIEILPKKIIVTDDMLKNKLKSVSFQAAVAID